MRCTGKIKAYKNYLTSFATNRSIQKDANCYIVRIFCDAYILGGTVIWYVSRRQCRGPTRNAIRTFRQLEDSEQINRYGADAGAFADVGHRPCVH